MGSTDPLARTDESLVHRMRVDGFRMNETEVTNAQFRSFVAATGYITIAERPSDWEAMNRHPPPGSPWENGHRESFNKNLRDELLAHERFDTLKEARVLIERWRRH